MPLIIPHFTEQLSKQLGVEADRGSANCDGLMDSLNSISAVHLLTDQTA